MTPAWHAVHISSRRKHPWSTASAGVDQGCQSSAATSVGRALCSVHMPQYEHCDVFQGGRTAGSACRDAVFGDHMCAGHFCITPSHAVAHAPASGYSHQQKFITSPVPVCFSRTQAFCHITRGFSTCSDRDHFMPATSRCGSSWSPFAESRRGSPDAYSLRAAADADVILSERQGVQSDPAQLTCDST